MTRQGMWFAVLGFFVMFSGMACAAGWQDNAFYDQASYGQGQGQGQGQSGSSSNGLFHFSPTTSKIARIGLDATGTVIAGLLGSHFGTIGTVVGGAAGFFVSKWVGDKLFGTGGYPQSYVNGSNTWSGGGNSNGNTSGSDSAQRWSRINSLLPAGGGNLEQTRQTFLSSMQNLQNTMASGDQSGKQAALDQYNQARDAYFAAKGSAQH